MNFQRLADDLADRHTRIQRTVRILENHLETFAARTQFSGAQVRDVVAFEANRAAG